MALLDTRMRRWAFATVVASAVLALLPWLASGVGAAMDPKVAERVAWAAAALLVCAVLTWFSPDPHDVARPEIVRRYYREALIPIAVYVPLVLLLREAFPNREALAVRALFAALNLAYFGVLTRAFVRYVRDSDELQRRIELESIAIAALAVAVGYTVAQFLQRAKLIAVAAEDAMGFVFVALAFAYVVARVVHGRRYQ